jgi:HK97 family phage major capsid protein
MSVIDIVRENFKARAEIQGELRSIDEAATADNRDYTDDEKATITEKRSALQAIDERITANLEMEARSTEIDNGLDRFLGVLADRESGDVPDLRSLGERFADTDEYRSWAKAGAHGSYRLDLDGMDFRAVSDTTLGATSGGAWVRPPLYPRIGQDFLDRRVYLIDRLPRTATTDGAVVYVQDKSPLADMADKAVEVTEGSAKPQAGITTAVVTEPFATIAAWVNITRQVAADVPQIQGYLDGRLRYSIKRRVDKQAIGGDGSAPNLRGLANRSGILTNAPSGAEARYITIRHSITLMEQSEAVPEIIVLNPADAELFDLTNATSAGLHAVMDNDVPGGAAALAGSPSRTAWGMEQIHSNAITSGTALLIDPTAVMVFDRQQPTAYLTDSHASNFTSNILTLLLEARLGLALFNPLGVLKVTFNGTS